MSLTARWPKASGRTMTGWFTMTMCQCTLLCQCSKLATKSTALVFHAPYPPDLALCDISLFLRMKLQLQGHC
jgi:hypothetical protein